MLKSVARQCVSQEGKKCVLHRLENIMQIGVLGCFDSPPHTVGSNMTKDFT